MRTLLLLFLAIGLRSQSIKPVHIKVLTLPEAVYAVSSVTPLERAEAERHVKPVLESHSLRLVDEAAAKADPESLVIEVSGAYLVSWQKDSGFMLQMQLATSRASFQGGEDPLAVHATITKAYPGRISTLNAMAEQLAFMSNQLLEWRATQGLKREAQAPLSGKEQPQPPNPSRSAQIQKSAKHSVIDFEFSEIKELRRPPTPRYPPYARERGIQGIVFTSLIIDPLGIPTEVTVIQGPRELQTVAAFYALHWTFEPAKLNGVAQWAKFRLRMPFKLGF